VMGIQVGWAAARWTFRSGREGEQAARLVEYVNRPRLGIAPLPKIVSEPKTGFNTAHILCSQAGSKKHDSLIPNGLFIF
jgi:hypothetical protein